MPNFLKEGGFTFFCWSNEYIGGMGSGPLEPMHVHVCTGSPSSNATKYWLSPVKFENNNSGFSTGELRKIEKIIKDNEKLFISEWKKHFGQ